MDGVQNRIEAPPMLRNQNEAGMTLFFCFSLLSHCTTNRLVNRNCPIKPKAIHICSLVMCSIHVFDDGKTIAMDQPCNSREIKNSIQESANRAIMRSSVNSRTMIHRNGHDPSAISKNQCRQKTMHMVEVWNPQKRFAEEHFNATSGIRSLVFQDSTSNRICNSRTEQSPCRILATISKPGHHLQA